jgi:HK97 family phage portal protein
MVFNRFFEDRAISFQTVFESGDDIAFGTLSDTHVTEETVWQITAVTSAVNMIASTISTLPVDCFYRDGDGARRPFRPKPAWVSQPDIAMARSSFYTQAIVSLLLDGNAFIRVFSRQGRVVNLMVLNPSTVEVKRNGGGTLTFTVAGEKKTLGDDEMIHITDILRPGDVRGISRVKMMKNAFGLSQALEAYASMFFGSGTNMNGIIEFPGNLSSEQAADLAANFDRRHRGWRYGQKTGILSGGATFKQTQAEPENAQAIESRRFMVEEIARAFSIPSHLLNIPGTTSYASLEESNRSWWVTGLRPLLARLEDSLSPLLAREPGGENAFLKWNIDSIVRSDLATRSQAYSTGLQAGYLTVNDVRRLEDLRPMESTSADAVRVPLANVNIDDSDVRAQRERVQMARDLVFAGYDPASVLEMLGLPPITHTGLPSVQLQSVAQNAQTVQEGGDIESQYKDEVT